MNGNQHGHYFHKHKMFAWNLYDVVVRKDAKEVVTVEVDALVFNNYSMSARWI